MTEEELEKVLGAPPAEAWRNCNPDVYSYIDRTEVKLHIALTGLEEILYESMRATSGKDQIGILAKGFLERATAISAGIKK